LKSHRVSRILEDMTLAEIEEKTIRLASKGVDLRTIWIELEMSIGRPLVDDEAARMTNGWKSAAPERAKVEARRLATVAGGARRQRRV
jgi:hypothetical protein